ncbi:MAG TPA: hypothetical protein VIJ23_21315 [Mycobacterium sp.]
MQSGSAGAVVPPAAVGLVPVNPDDEPDEEPDEEPDDDPAAPLTGLAQPVTTSPAHSATANDQRRTR